MNVQKHLRPILFYNTHKCTFFCFFCGDLIFGFIFLLLYNLVTVADFEGTLIIFIAMGQNR